MNGGLKMKKKIVLAVVAVFVLACAAAGFAQITGKMQGGFGPGGSPARGPGMFGYGPAPMHDKNVLGMPRIDGQSMPRMHRIGDQNMLGVRGLPPDMNNLPLDMNTMPGMRGPPRDMAGCHCFPHGIDANMPARRGFPQHGARGQFRKSIPGDLNLSGSAIQAERDALKEKMDAEREERLAEVKEKLGLAADATEEEVFAALDKWGEENKVLSGFMPI